MIQQVYYLIVFDGTHATLEAEAVFQKVGVKVKVIPLPSVISTGCGFSIKVLPNEVKAVEELLKQALFEWTNLYKLIKLGNETKVEPWHL